MHPKRVQRLHWLEVKPIRIFKLILCLGKYFNCTIRDAIGDKFFFFWISHLSVLLNMFKNFYILHWISLFFNLLFTLVNASYDTW